MPIDISEVPATDWDLLESIVKDGLVLLREKDREYGSSWCRRGGVGAFFAVWRKIDRLEEQLKARGYDILDTSNDPSATESLDDTIKDAMLFFALVLEKRKAIRNHICSDRPLI